MDLSKNLETLNYEDIKEYIFNTIINEESKVSIDYLYEVSKLLHQDDLFSIFYMNRDLEEVYISFIIDMLNNKVFHLSSDQMLNVLFSFQAEDKLIEKYFNIFLENTNNLLDLKSNIEIYDNLLDITNKYMNDNKDITIKHIVNKNLSYFGIDNTELNQLEVIFKEVFENENLNVSEINHVGLGSTTSVYSIGNKVIKVGVNKKYFEKINHPRILSPILSNEINLNVNDKEFVINTEVTHYVETDNIFENNAYVVFKDLKNSGIVWTDPQRDNIGRIMIDEQEYFIIIDSEFIYKEDYPNIEYGNRFYFDKFEKRYNDELENNYIKK